MVEVGVVVGVGVEVVVGVEVEVVVEVGVEVGVEVEVVVEVGVGMTPEIATLIAAFDSLADLNACAESDFEREARWMLAQRPDTLAVEMADRVRAMVARLGLRSSRVTMLLGQKLRFVAQSALDAGEDYGTENTIGPRRAERIFSAHEDQQIAKARREWEASQAERAARPQQPDYAPPSVVARAFGNAKAAFAPRPSWAGAPTKGTPAPWEPSGEPNADLDDVAPGKRGGLATMATALDVDEINSAERDAREGR